MERSFFNQDITLDKIIVSVVSAYAFLQLVFYFLNLPSSILYALPSALVPLFFLLRASSKGAFEFEQFSLLVMLGSVAVFVASVPFQPYPDLYDHTKYLLLYFFYFMGVNSHLDSSMFALRQAKFLLLGLPVILLGFYWFVLGGSGYYFGSIAFVANRNNLSGLIMAIALVITITAGQHGLSYLLIPVLMLVGTLGGVVGMVGAFALIAIRKPTFLIGALLVTAALTYLALLVEWSFMDRISNAVLILWTMAQSNFFDALVNMSFEDASAITDGNYYDASVFWRLKQWLDIVLMMVAEPSKLWLGFGFTASETLTFSEKLPHNDWLRVLFEGGIFSMALFATLVLTALKDTSRLDQDSLVIALGIFIFMLSENLLDNFLLSFLVFFSLGLARQKAHLKTVASNTDDAQQLSE